MICSWCYGPLEPADTITVWHGSDEHWDCAMTEVGSGVERNYREYQQWLGMTDDEIEPSTEES